MLFGALTKGLGFLGRIYAGQADLVLGLAAIQYRDGVAVTDTDDLAHQRGGTGGQDYGQTADG